MTTSESRRSTSPYDVLRQFARREATEYCSLCNTALRSKHAHLLNPATRKILCACPACAVQFEGLYQRIPQRVRFLDGFQLSDAQWDQLAIPIQMAFFFRSISENRVVGIYPSPAGPIQSALSDDGWDAMEAANPELRLIEPDVEALLIHRLGPAKGHAGPATYVVPIDEAFRLVGLIRTHWRGLSGGTQVWSEIGSFYSEMKERACHN